MAYNRLTAKQNAFAHAVADGSSLSDAYRRSYTADKMKPNVVRVEACRLAAHPIVALTVEALLRQNDTDHRMQAVKRRAFVLDELERHAREAPTAGVRVRALELLGKSVGLFIPKEEVAPAKSIEELEIELMQLLSREN